jgi:type IV pilus assembly protein PilO
MASAPSSGFATLPTGAKVGLLVLMLGLVTALYYFVFHMSLTDEIDQATSQHAQLENDLRAAQQRQEEYLRLTQELAAREARDRDNKRVLPEEAEIPAFLQDLNRLAELSGLGMSLVEPRPEEPGPSYTRIPVTLALRGKYHQVAKFFYNVSRLERAIGMEDLQLREPQVVGEDVVLRINVRATTYRRPAPGAAQGAPARGGRPPAGGGMMR